MEAKLAAAGKLFTDFKAAYVRNDNARCSQLLAQLKLRLTEFPSLPPLYQQTPTAQRELLLAREVLEHAVVLSVRQRDEVAFERHFLQLKTYYTDTRHLLPVSPQEYPILGLNLLRLLVQNRIAEFHTELELLAPEAQENVCIKHAIELEQWLMEGAYNRVLTARQRVPDETYVYFMDRLMETVRDEIAGCSEKAFDFLTLTDAKKLLMLNTDEDISRYAKQHSWTLRDGCLVFQKSKEQSASRELPSMPIISQMLGYAKELERIV
ncbi:hypothetical protein CBR_g36847 [Chara braunii]|uniref:PCI domain-containing protein n=1 Tax=Chara braunii TaxID=69332 RepID=A0A388LLZ4_CHABU|nr:hypothetical protein CBR_g36847 [Chara braunii]|eukprot:GBG83232.1 hypothetical protein CBR_g36847 [Chara braunii]